MKRKWFLNSKWVFILIMFFAASCKDDDNDELIIEPALSLSEASYEFGNESGEYTLAVFSTTDWTLAKEGDWLTVDKTSGSGNAVIKVTASANTSDESRTGSITLKSEGLSDQKIEFSQEAENIILKVLGEDSYLIKPEGGLLKIDIEANIDYTFELSDWMEVAGTYTLTKSEITLHIEPNLWEKSRVGSVVIRAAETEEVVRTISLEQGSMAWNLPESVELDKMGEERVIDIVVPGDLTWSVQDLFKGTEEEKWLHPTVTANGLRIVADKSTALVEREVAVLVTLDKTGMSKMITFKQAAREALALGNDNGWVGGAHSENCIAFEYLIEILSDEPDGWDYTLTEKPEDWTVEKTEEGIRVIGTDRVAGGTAVLEMGINVAMKDGSSTLNLKFRQDPYSAPTLQILNYLGGTESAEIIAAPEGGEQTRYVKFDLGERIEFEYEGDIEQWAHITPIDGNSIRIVVDELPDGEGARNGIILVNLMRGDRVVATKEITVQQGAEEPYIRLVDTEGSLLYKQDDGRYKLPHSEISFLIEVEANVEWEISNFGEVNTQYTCVKVDDTTIQVTCIPTAGPTMVDLIYNVHTKGSTSSDPLNKQVIICWK